MVLLCVLFLLSLTVLGVQAEPVRIRRHQR